MIPTRGLGFLTWTLDGKHGKTNFSVSGNSGDRCLLKEQDLAAEIPEILLLGAG